VVRHGRNHYFPVHSSAQGPPRGLCLAIRREIPQVVQRWILQAIQPAKQRRDRLLKRLLKRRAIQRRMQPKVQVKVEVEIQAETHVPTQRTTQSNIRPDVHRGVLRETRETLWRTVAGYERRVTRDGRGKLQTPSAKFQTNLNVSMPQTLNPSSVTRICAICGICG
jgi:hypothetical protein